VVTVRVLCLVELDGGGAADASLRAVAFARGLAGQDGQVATVVFGGAGQVPGGALAAHGATAAYAVEPGAVPGYAPVAWARALAGLAGQVRLTGQEQTGGQEPAAAVVAAATDRGNEVMAHLGALTGLPMAANCVAAHMVEPGEFRLTRQRWAGLLLEDASLTAPAALLTVATEALDAAAEGAEPGTAQPGTAEPGIAEPGTAEPGAAGSRQPVPVHVYEPGLADGDLAVCATESAAQAGGASLATARVVVGGGRGVGGPEGFAPLEELAALLGGVVGVSRVVTSEGWRPHRQQVGQTGTRITPQVYLACGISGAIQHMAGCAGAKHIIAVNTDAGAPILSHADYAVVGDLREVIPALIAAIRARTA
jgi:electron transfer flavoprotein alpha subunit